MAEQEHALTLRLPHKVWRVLQIAKIDGKIKSIKTYLVELVEKDLENLK